MSNFTFTPPGSKGYGDVNADRSHVKSLITDYEERNEARLNNSFSSKSRFYLSSPTDNISITKVGFPINEMDNSFGHSSTAPKKSVQEIMAWTALENVNHRVLNYLEETEAKELRLKRQLQHEKSERSKERVRKLTGNLHREGQ